ncbi:urease accessory protein UreE [Roseitranquillus sediminis]|uniref:urease accessory protein UreE n=1 Tax=Roseitranquillus sediminis TaxID=2809051 RepID=UPI001D0C3124|nr:urease accessory protein UreE [Roseitranquillus sediminis]MBM9595146.1 urease accessory protein UreE [Roseitranquillus sediminis]
MTAEVFSDVRRAGQWSGATESVTLAYEDRLLRRRRLRTDGGGGIAVDLPQVTGLAAGDALASNRGRLVEVRAAEEPLIEVRGDLPRLAWHIGNRHTPCQVGQDRLLIRRDPVLADMLRRLGAELCEVRAPFTPEGGAYGHGRTLGHDHGHHHE